MGLIKTGLKAAVAVKTAHYVHERIERRQQAQWATQGDSTGAAQAPASPAPAEDVGLDRSAVLSQLKDLGGLKATGVLTDAEFEHQKALILGN
jgi:hypothetical protein